jgi:hypothetical protein
MNQNEVSLDNKTIAKLAMAIAFAQALERDGEVIGPTARKVLDYLKAIDNLDHVKNAH